MAVQGEAVTLQLGPYANYAGAHWWTLQEAGLSQNSEVCGDVLFRRGETLHGAETYTPRLIALDLKGSVRSLRDDDSLYEDKGARHSTPAWTGNVSVHREEPGAPANGRNGVSAEKTPATETSNWVWSDVLQTPLHPKSLCIVNDHSHGGDGLESFSQGEAVFKTQLEEIEDRLHFFTEECDYLQGFQVLCDVHNGFSGLGVRTVELLHDEYPGRGILSFGTCPTPSGDSSKASYQLMNYVLALGPLSSQSSLYCPLSVMSSLGRRAGPPAAFPQLLYNAGVQYHSSAVLAVALDTLSVPYRMSSSGLSMLHLTEALTFGGRKMLSAACSVPFPLAPAMSLADALLPHQSAAPWCSVSPCKAATVVFSQSVVLRGIPELRPTRDHLARKQPPSCLHICETEVLQSYLSALYPHTVSIAHQLGAPCVLGPSFPQFFSPYVTKDGFTTGEPQPKGRVVGRIPLLGALQTSSALHQMLRSLCDDVGKMDMRRGLNFATAAVEQDDFREVVEEVRSLAHCYRPRQGDEMDDSD